MNAAGNRVEERLTLDGFIGVPALNLGAAAAEPSCPGGPSEVTALRGHRGCANRQQLQPHAPPQTIVIRVHWRRAQRGVGTCSFNPGATT